MAFMKILDGRTWLWQWDTGVEIEICECKIVTECHFVTPGGLVKVDVQNNICKIPDNVLVNSGCLTVYAFARDDVYGITQHEFRINVNARPKPADYIDESYESTTIDFICDRLKVLPECKGEQGEKGDKGDKGDTGVQGPQGIQGTSGADGKDAVIDATLTQSGQAADAAKTGEAIGELKNDKADKFTVGSGLQMADGVLRVKPEKKWELLETVTLSEAVTSVKRTKYPNGEPYKLSAAKVIAKFYYPISSAIGSECDFKSDGRTVGKVVISIAQQTTSIESYCSTVIYQARPVAGLYELSGAYGTQGGGMNIMYPPNANFQDEPAETIIDEIDCVAWLNSLPARTTIAFWGVRANA